MARIATGTLTFFEVNDGTAGATGSDGTLGGLSIPYGQLRTNTDLDADGLDGEWKIFPGSTQTDHTATGTNVMTNGDNVLFLTKFGHGGIDRTTFYDDLEVGDTCQLRVNAASASSTTTFNSIPSVDGSSSIGGDDSVITVTFTIETKPTPSASDADIYRFHVDVSEDTSAAILGGARFTWSRTLVGASSRLDLAYFSDAAGANPVYPSGTVAEGNYTAADSDAGGITRNFQGTNIVTWEGLIELPVSTAVADYEISQITGDTGLSNRIDFAYSDEDDGVGNPQFSSGTFEAGNYDGATLAASNNFIGTNVVSWDGLTAEPAVSTTVGDYEWSRLRGITGINSATVLIYIRSVAEPTTTPTGDSTYTFDGNSLTFANANGWSATIPTGTAPLWSRAATAAANTATDAIADNEWSGVVLGEAANTATVTSYQRTNSATAPSPDNPTGNTTYTFATSVSTYTTANGWSDNIPDKVAGNTHLWVITSAAASNSDTDTIADTEWNEPQIISEDGVDGVDGVPGNNSATVNIYKRSPTTPTDKPTGNTTYTFASGAVSFTTANGWSSSLPSGTGTLYIRVASAIGTGTTDTIADSEWSGVVQSEGADGGTGADGLNSATVSLYRRNSSDTAPTDLSNSTTYTFSTGVLATPNNSWTQIIPTKGTNTKLWYIAATAAANTATDAIPASEWSAPQLLNEDGDKGDDGVPGNNSATVSIYKRSPTTPTDKPTGNTTYTFASGAVSFTTANGWTVAVPTGTNTLYTRVASAIGTGTTDTIADTEWSVVVQSEGTDGGQGSRGAGRFDRTFIDSTPPTVGNSEYNDDALRTVCEAHGGTYTESNNTCSVELGEAIAGDTVVLTYFPGGTVSAPTGIPVTSGAIHDGTGTDNNDWEGYAVQIDGNLLVQGTVALDSLQASGSENNGVTVVDGDGMRIFDESNILRVVIGNLAATGSGGAIP